jgi:hypothetical protein
VEYGIGMVDRLHIEYQSEYSLRSLIGLAVNYLPDRRNSVSDYSNGPILRIVHV